MKKIYIYSVLFFMACAAFSQTFSAEDKLKEILVKIQKEIENTAAARLSYDIFKDGRILLYLGEENGGGEIMSVVNQKQITVSEEVLKREEPHCLAAFYAHEMQHVSDTKELKKRGIVNFPSLDDEVSAYALTYVYMTQKMKESGKNYFDNCADKSLTVFHEAVSKGGFEQMVERIEALYGKNYPLALTDESIARILKELPGYEQKAVFFNKETASYFINNKKLPSAEQYFTAYNLGYWYIIDSKDLKEMLEGKNNLYEKYTQYWDLKYDNSRKMTETARKIFHNIK